MSELVARIIVGVALGVGLLANRWLRPFADSEMKGIKLEALVGPIGRRDAKRRPSEGPIVDRGRGNCELPNTVVS